MPPVGNLASMIRRIVAALVLVAVASASAGELAKRPIPFRTQTMGTWATLTLVTADSSAVADLAYQSLLELHRVDSLMSNWTQTSEVARINRDAGADRRRRGSRSRDVLALAERVTRESDGAMDITVEPLVRLWGFLGGPRRVPSQAEITKALASVGPDKLRFDARAPDGSFHHPRDEDRPGRDREGLWRRPRRGYSARRRRQGRAGRSLRQHGGTRRRRRERAVGRSEFATRRIGPVSRHDSASTTKPSRPPAATSNSSTRTESATVTSSIRAPDGRRKDWFRSPWSRPPRPCATRGTPGCSSSVAEKARAIAKAHDEFADRGRRTTRRRRLRRVGRGITS